MSQRDIDAYWRRNDLGLPCKRFMSYADSIHHGYQLAEVVEEGDWLPHPQDNEVFFHALRSGLRRRGLDASFFGVVIEWKGRKAYGPRRKNREKLKAASTKGVRP